MTEKQCQNCRFYKPLKEYKPKDSEPLFLGSECHRRAPLAVVDRILSRTRPAVRWPQVGPEDFCGEFEPLSVTAKDIERAENVA